MESRLPYTSIGIFVVVFLAALILIGIWLSTGLSKKSYDTYMVIMKESVSGLNENAPVKYNGVTVGYVSEMKLNPRDPQEVRLLLQIEVGTPITTGTTATLAPQGITGLVFINLNGGPVGAPPLEPEPNQPYPIIATAPSLLFRIDTIVTRISTDFDKISEAFSKFISPENETAFRNSLANIEKITGTLAANSEEINKSVKATEKILQNTAAVSDQFPVLVQRLSAAGDATTKAMKAGEQTLRQFNEQTLPSANAALNDLDEITRQLVSVAQDLKQNPSIIIRGKTPTPLGPGEH